MQTAAAVSGFRGRVCSCDAYKLFWTFTLWRNSGFSASATPLPLCMDSDSLYSLLLLWVPVPLLQEGGPLPGPETGLLSNTRKWIVRGDTCADKASDFIGKGHPGGEQCGKGTQENCSATWLTMSGFMVMGLVSGWSLANHSNSESFLVARTSLSQDGC